MSPRLPSRDYIAEAEVGFRRLNGHAGAEAPIPLVPELTPGEEYPSGALGDVLGEAANAIARKVQVPIEIAAQSVLAVASLAAQTHADIKLPYGQTRPLSLFLTSVAATGDRKTSADHEAMRRFGSMSDGSANNIRWGKKFIAHRWELGQEKSAKLRGIKSSISKRAGRH